MGVLPAIVEVAIGLVLIFLSLSAICSTIAELISNLLALRSRYLRQGIIALLSDPVELKRRLAEPLPGGDLVAKVLGNPRLQKLDPTRPEDSIVQRLENFLAPLTISLRSRMVPNAPPLAPSIPPSLFASVLLEHLKWRAPNYGMRLMTLRMRLRTLANSQAQGVRSETSLLPPLILQAIEQRDARQAIADIRQGLPLVADEKVRTVIANLISGWEFEQIHDGICSLEPSRPREILLSLWNQAEDEAHWLDKFTASIAEWYDDGMDQVSQWYKQHINHFLRVIAILVCLVLNADVTHIAQMLWRDPTLRAALVAQAQAASQQPGVVRPAMDGQVLTTVQTLEGQLAEASRLPLGWDCEELNAIVRDGYRLQPAAPGLLDDPGLCGEVVRTLADGRVEVLNVDGGSFSFSNLAYKLCGLALMSIGVSLGANFWYKLLKQLLSLREERSA